MKSNAPLGPVHTSRVAGEPAANKEEAPETGGLGASPVPYGGNLWRERESRHCNLNSQFRFRFNPLKYAESIGRPIDKRKGAQPLRVVGRQKRVFARVPGGKPARANHIFG